MADYRFPWENLPFFGEFIVVDGYVELQTKKARPRCPFYGFRWTMGVVVDEGGNGCAWLKQGYPCRMECSGEEPRWDKCEFNNDQKRDIIARHGSTPVFPSEFAPREGEWKGITVEEWLAYHEGLRSKKH